MGARHAAGTSTGLRVGAVAALLVLGGSAAALSRSAGSQDAANRAPAGAVSAPAATPRAPLAASTRSDAEASAAAGRTTSTPARAADAALQRCARAARLGEAAVAASRQGLRDWADHVGSYHDLVDGRAPYSQAQRIWARTRAAGPAGLYRFATAERRWLDVRATCNADSAPAGAARDQACADRVAAAEAAVTAARVALGQWHEHQRDMRAADRAAIDRPTAQVRFRTLVREAPRALKAARSSAARLAAAPACPGPA